MIVKRNGVLKLYCKGADSVIFERLHPSSEALKQKTTEHLNVSARSIMHEWYHIVYNIGTLYVYIYRHL